GRGTDVARAVATASLRTANAELGDNATPSVTVNYSADTGSRAPSTLLWLGRNGGAVRSAHVPRTPRGVGSWWTTVTVPTAYVTFVVTPVTPHSVSWHTTPS